MAKEITEDRKQREEWEAEDDVRTLMRAEQIKSDKKRMARAKKHMNRVKSVLSGA